MRTWAAVAMLVVAAYPAMGGPLAYAVGRGWITRRSLDPYFAPIEETVGLPGDWFGTDLLGDYVSWFGNLGRRHAASD